MAEIKPFKALLYNKEKITDLSKVVCPPYDIITKDTQENCYNSSKYNFVRIILGKEKPTDTYTDNRYARAKRYLEQWLKRKIIIQDKEDCFYFHKQTFKINDEHFSRIGFIGLLRLKKSVLGHEKTKFKPKEDRLKLLKCVRANLSPIFVLFSDHNKIINKIFNKYLKNKNTFLEFTDRDNNRHYIWKIKESEIKGRLIGYLKRKQIFIADGHHRYEVGLRYCLNMQKKLKAPDSNNASWNYMLSYFTDIGSRGLIIKPVHRLIKLDNRDRINKIPTIFKKYFKIQAIKDKNNFLSYFDFMKKTKQKKFCFGLCLYDNTTRFYILKLKNNGLIKKLFPGYKKEFYNLDIFVLENLIIKRLLNIKDKTKIDYSSEIIDAIKNIEERKADILFVVNPVDIKEVKRIALIKERMPSKSTYFYPKVLAGIVIHKFDAYFR